MTDESTTRRGFLLGAAGAAAAGATGGASAQEGGSGGNSSSGGSGGGGGKTHTVEVVNNEFKPADKTIAPGDTVKWVWKAGGHNVKAESGNWGTKGGQNKTYSKGHTYTHTFSKTGDFPYICVPHEPMGMTGTITVQEGGAQTSGSSKPAIPGSAKALGVATSGALAFTLGIAYFFMKFGGDYGDFDYE